MRDGSVACIASVIISLVTAKSKFEINALIKKDSYKNILKQQSQNAVHPFLMCS